VIELKEVLFNQRCPKCSSEDLEYYSIEPEGETMVQDLECNSCRNKFRIFSDTRWVIMVEEGTRWKFNCPVCKTVVVTNDYTLFWEFQQWCETCQKELYFEGGGEVK